MNDIAKNYVDLTDPNSIIKYIINNYEKFLLLFLVFIIVYFIENITQINALIYGSTQIPIIGISQNNTNADTKVMKKRIKSKK
jgi:hypothetical protein